MYGRRINKFFTEKNIVEVITVKKNKFSEFFKGKGYYVLLFIGVVAIAAVAIIGSQLSAKQSDQNYVNLNDTDKTANNDKNQVGENKPVSDGVVNNGSKTDDTASNSKDGHSVANNDPELEGYYAPQSDAEKAQNGMTKEDSTETSSKNVKNDYTAALAKLSFDAKDSSLAWPVSGNVLMNYSMDHTILFATLKTYKCNPAIIIDAKVGKEVKSAAKGYVTKIDAKNDETGYTITVGIGSGYTLTYGQLDKKSVSLKVGDPVAKGAVIGKVATPTNYYLLEGSNLYFEVLKKDKPVNPMLFLAD